MPFGVGNGLSVRVTANTRSFTEGMEESRDELTKLSATSQTSSASVQTLQNRINELGDEFGRTQRKASSLNRSIIGLTGSIGALGITVRGFNTTQLAGMVAGFGTLATTIVPLTSSLFGLAAAAGGVAGGFTAVLGTGFLAYGQQVAESSEEAETALEGLALALEPAQEQLQQTASSIGQQFVPLISDAIDALPALIRNIGAALGNLQPFADALRDAGDVAFEVLPEMAAFFLQLGRESLPRLRELGSWLANNWQNILETSVETLRELTPVLLGFIDGMIDLLGPMNEFGTTVLQEVLPAVNNFISTLGDAIETVQENARMIKAVLIGSFIAITGPIGAVIALLIEFRDTVASTLGRLNSQYIQPFIQGFESVFDNRLRTVLSETGDTISIFIESLTELFGLEGDAEEWGGTVGSVVNDIQDALITINDLAQGDISLSSVIDLGGLNTRGVRNLQQGFQQALPQIERLINSLHESFDGFMNFMNTVVLPVAQQVLNKFLIPLFNDLATVIGEELAPFIDELSQTITALNGHFRTVGQLVSDVWEEIDGVVVPIAEAVGDAINDSLVFYIQSFIDAMHVVMNLVQGDFDEALESIKDIIGNVVDVSFDLVGAFGDALGALGTWLAGDGKDIAIEALSALPGIIVDLLASSGGFLADALKQLGTWLEKAPSVIADLATDLGNAIADGIRSAIIDMLENLDPRQHINIGNGRVLPGGGIPGEGNLLQSGGLITEGGMARLHEGERVVPAAQVTDRGHVEVNASTNPTVEVIVEGDTSVIENATARMVDEQRRRTNRQTGSTTNI